MRPIAKRVLHHLMVVLKEMFDHVIEQGIAAGGQVCVPELHDLGAIDQIRRILVSESCDAISTEKNSSVLFYSHQNSHEFFASFTIPWVLDYIKSAQDSSYFVYKCRPALEKLLKMSGV